MTQNLNRDLTLHTDYYELNMMYTYWKKGIHNRNSVFECSFRQRLRNLRWITTRN